MANLCIKTPSSAILVLIFQLLVLRPRPIDRSFFGDVTVAAKLCDFEIFAISTLLAGIMMTKEIHVWLNRLGVGLTITIIGTNPFLQHCQKYKISWMEALLTLWQQNWEWRVIYSCILKKNQFLFNYLLRYKLTPVVLWKLKPEMGKFHIKGNFSRFLGNFTEDHKYFLQESLVTFAIYSTSAGPTTPAKIWTKAKLAWLRGFLDHIGQFHKFTHPPILTWGVLWWKTQNTKRPRASRFSSGGSLDSASICVDWVGFRKQP